MSEDQKVFVNVSMSLDGYIAPEGMDTEHFHDPEYKDWMNKWMSLQAWAFPLKFFRENLDLGEGGETGTDNDLAETTFKRTGVSIMGKRIKSVSSCVDHASPAAPWLGTSWGRTLNGLSAAAVLCRR